MFAVASLLLWLLLNLPSFIRAQSHSWNS
jgi:hypothetical protein